MLDDFLKTAFFTLFFLMLLVTLHLISTLHTKVDGLIKDSNCLVECLLFNKCDKFLKEPQKQ